MLNRLYILTACIFLVFPLLCWTRKGFQTRYDSLVSRCEPITMSMCKGLPYNKTHFPNLLGHETQQEAEKELNQFKPLVSLNCSKELRPFLCSLYAPVCISIGGSLQMLRPCRHNCKRVRKGCLTILKRFGFAWPKSFRCKLFPKKKNNNLCIDWGKHEQKRGSQGEKKKNRKNKGRKQSKRNKKGGRNRKKAKRNGRKGKKNGQQAGRG